MADSAEIKERNKRHKPSKSANSFGYWHTKKGLKLYVYEESYVY